MSKRELHNPFPNLHPTMLMETYQGRLTIGWGPWRAKWHSICSRHYIPEVTCKTCSSGHYINNMTGKIDSFMYKHWKVMWLWKHSPHLRKLRTIKLRGIK